MKPARIRSVELTDAEAIAAIYAPIVTSTAISFEEHAPDTSEIERRILASRPMFPWLVAERDGEIAGYAYAGAHRARAGYRWSVDVSVYVSERARRCGTARALYLALFRLLTRQGYVTAFAGIALPNAASLALHQSLGFTAVGTYANVGFKAGAWRDVSWLARALGPQPARPHDPRPLDALSSEEIAAAVEGT